MARAFTSITSFPLRFSITGAVLTLLSACTEPTPNAMQQQLVADLNEPQQLLFEQGQLKAYSCAACHGRYGISSHPAYPSLAGRPVGELSAALNAYRSGERKNALMTPQARGLSNTDIDALVYYFSLQTPAAKNTPGY
jgi:cytochrome c553